MLQHSHTIDFILPCMYVCVCACVGERGRPQFPSVGGGCHGNRVKKDLPTQEKSLRQFFFTTYQFRQNVHLRHSTLFQHHIKPRGSDGNLISAPLSFQLT